MTRIPMGYFSMTGSSTAFNSSRLPFMSNATVRVSTYMERFTLSATWYLSRISSAAASRRSCERDTRIPFTPRAASLFA